MSVLGSISYKLGTPTRSCSLPQIILEQTKTMKLALNPNPMIVVTKLVSKPIVRISTPQPIFKTKPQTPEAKTKNRTRITKTWHPLQIYNIRAECTQVSHNPQVSRDK